MAGPLPTVAPVAPRTVRMVGPDGSAFSIPEDQAREALRLGARIETPDEARTREMEARREGEGFQAGVEGFARGLTGSLSDVVGAIGGQGRAMSERREVFPVASVVPEVIGGAMGIIPGGSQWGQ
jgi:hypothetical protein